MSPVVSGGAASGMGMTPNLKILDKDNGQAGLIAGAHFGRTAVQAVAINRGYIVRFVPSRSMLIASIAFAVAVADAGDTACDVGIYSAAMARLASSGSTTGQLNSVGVKNVALTAALAVTAGTIYYAGISTASSTAQLAALGVSSANSFALFGTANGVTEFEQMAAAGPPLPATFTPSGAPSTTWVPLLALRES